LNPQNRLQSQKRTVEAPAPEEQPAERCIAWIEAHCKILSDRGHGLIPFALFDYQKDFIRTLWGHREVICLKARQIGMTETIAATAVYCVNEFPGWTVLILSKGKDEADEVLSKCRICYDNLPPDVQTPLKNASITSRLILANRSRIIPKATTAGAGRTFNAQLLIIDEWAHQERQQALYTAVSPTARSAGNRIVGLSTANGVGNYFYTLWQKAQREQGAGDTMYPLFFGWSVRPGRDEAWYKQATWGYDDWQAAQEFPAAPEEAFVLSGRMRFDHQSLLDLAKRTEAPKREEQLEGGVLSIWEEPAQAGRYVAGCDTAEGLLKGDYCALVILDFYSGREVAVLHGKWDPAQFAALVNALCHRYNDAFLGVERNGPGHAVLLALSTLHDYPALYCHQHYDAVGMPVERPGWVTDSRSKPIMIDALATAIRERRPFRNGALIGECMTYVIDDKGGTGASGTTFDDILMATAVAEMMRHYDEPSQEVVSLAEELDVADMRIDARYG